MSSVCQEHQGDKKDEPEKKKFKGDTEMEEDVPIIYLPEELTIGREEIVSTNVDFGWGFESDSKNENIEAKDESFYTGLNNDLLCTLESEYSLEELFNYPNYSGILNQDVEWSADAISSIPNMANSYNEWDILENYERKDCWYSKWFRESKEFDWNDFPTLDIFETYTISQKAILCKSWAMLTPAKLRKIVTSVNSRLEFEMGSTIRPEHNDLIIGCTKLLNILFCANIYCKEKLLNNTGNYILSLSHHSETYQIAEKLGFDHFDITNYLIPLKYFVSSNLSNVLDPFDDNHQGKFSILFYPFILDIEFRIRAWWYKSHNEHCCGDHFFVDVRRDNVVNDTLHELNLALLEEPSVLKLSLKVNFKDEVGIDDGGLAKEFFSLFTTKLFEEKCHWFVTIKNQKHYWLATNSEYYYLLGLKKIGVVLGMAINNRINLNICFPPIFYKKLMGLNGTLEDLIDLDKGLYLSLKELLSNEEDDIEDIIGWNFLVPVPNSCQNELHELKKCGSRIPVTQSNKKEFVDLYVDFLLNKSIQSQFEALKEGFFLVTNPTFLNRYILPNELESLICGERILNFIELEQAVVYKRCNKRHKLIKNFWQVVHLFTEEQKKLLLKFITSSECVPVGGMKELEITIIRHSGDSEQLPTASTCSNSLFLPAYSTKEKLRAKLLTAIDNCEGFGLA